MSSIHKFHICDFIFGPLSAVTYFCFPGYSHSAFSICGFSPLSTRNILAVKNSQCKMKKGKELGFRNFALGSQGRPVPAAQPEGRDRWGPFVSGPREVEHRSAFPLLASAPHAQQCAPVLSSVFLPVPQFFTDPLATSAICDSSLLAKLGKINKWRIFSMAENATAERNLWNHSFLLMIRKDNLY